MTQLKPLDFLIPLFAVVLCVTDAHAITRRARAPKVPASLAAVCPKIQTFNPRQMFWKNNKPQRASSAINAPIIGYYKQMTLGNNVGFRSPVGSSTATLYDSKGNSITRMIPYPCRSDHCGGRVVSQTATDTARRAAIAKTHSPTGYVKITRNTCVKIDDIGRCFGNEVDKGRPLCNQVVG